MKVLFLCHIFEGKDWLDSAARQEIVQPVLSSGLVHESKVLVFSKDMDYFEHLISTRVNELINKLQDKPVLIYGAGAHTKKFFHYLKKLNIKAIVDRESYLWGSQFLGFPVISPDELKINKYPIVISSRAYEDSLIMEIKSNYNYQPPIFGLYNLKSITKKLDVQRVIEITNTNNSYKPDLILYMPPLPNEALTQNDVNIIKKNHSCKWITVWWDYDDDSDNNSYLDFERESLIYSDLILDAGNYSKTTRLKEKLPPYHNHKHTNKVFVGPSVCDPKLFYPSDEKKYDIAIFGSATGKRGNWIKLLKEHYPNNFHHFGDSYGNQKVMPMAEYAKAIAQTKIFVNTQTYSFRSQCKGKVREALASNVLLLEEDNIDTREFYNLNEGIVFFNCFEDLVDKIDLYLENDDERERLAKVAHDWFSRNYECKVWFRKILKQLANLN